MFAVFDRGGASRDRHARRPLVARDGAAPRVDDRPSHRVLLARVTRAIIWSMTEIAGGIGAGTVIVFQPATPSGGLEVALGIQRFWQKTLKQAGRPAACLIANTRVERIEGTPPIEMPIAVGDKGVAAIGDWADEAATAALVVARGGRWGLVATLTAAGIRGGIETKLFEAKPGSGAANIATWSFSGAASAVHERDVSASKCRGRVTSMRSARPTPARRCSCSS